MKACSRHDQELIPKAFIQTLKLWVLDLYSIIPAFHYSMIEAKIQASKNILYFHLVVEIPRRLIIIGKFTIRDFDDTLGKVGTIRTVGDHDNRHALFVKLAEQFHNLPGGFGIEIAGGLIR